MESWLESLQTEYEIGPRAEKTPEGLLRTVGIGYFVAAGILSHLGKKKFIDQLKKAVCEHSDTESHLYQRVEALSQGDLSYEDIKAFATEPATQHELEHVFLRKYETCSTQFEISIRDLEMYLNRGESSKCLQPLTKEMMIALNLEKNHRSSSLKGASLAVYVHVALMDDCVYLLIPRSFQDMPMMESLDSALYANYDKQFNDAIVGFSKALSSVEAASVDCIVPHSQLRSLILEAVKFDLLLEIPRVIMATKFNFVKSCTDCNDKGTKVKLECGHWLCKECLMLNVYQRTQHYHVPESIGIWELNSCCKVSADEIKALLTDEEVQALHLDLTLSPHS